MYNNDVYKENSMTDIMIRKQIYIPSRQDTLLKKLARQRGVSEAEVIRQALDREVQMPGMEQNGEEAFAKMEKFMEERKAKYAGNGESYKWNRAEIYEERESRWVKPDQAN
jgi:hypothetical protein